MDEETARKMFREKIAPRLAQIKRGQERARSEGLVHFTQTGRDDNKPSPAMSPEKHAKAVLDHVDSIWKAHSNPVDAIAAAHKALPYSDIKAAHDYAAQHGDDAMASRAVKLRSVMNVHQRAGTADAAGKSHIGGGPVKPPPIPADARRPAAPAARPNAVTMFTKAAAPKSFQTGAKGGQFYTLPSGRKVYKHGG